MLNIRIVQQLFVQCTRKISPISRDWLLKRPRDEKLSKKKTNFTLNFKFLKLKTCFLLPKSRQKRWSNYKL